MNDVVNLYHADGGQPARIAALEEIPRILDLGKARQFYQDQGELLADALWAALPGGTLDVLLAQLLERRASLFRVPFEDQRENRDDDPYCHACGRGDKAQGETG